MSERREVTETRAIPGYPGMEVDTDGYVYRNGRLLPPQVGVTGYIFYYWKGPDGRGHSLGAHRAVALGFHGSPPAGKNQAAHSDGNKRNNTPENVRWVSAKENAADRERHGRTARGDRSGARTKPESYHTGETHHRAKLTDAEVALIKTSRDSSYAAATRFGVHPTTIQKIRRGLFRVSRT